MALVGDVAGHGPKAARLATFVRARFAALAASTSDPAELLELTNADLVDRPHRELASAVCLRFRPEEERLTLPTAGHPPPLRLPELEELSPGARPTCSGPNPTSRSVTGMCRWDDLCLLAMKPA